MSRNLSRRSVSRRRPLGLQQLESRGMLAGNVTASITGTTLNLIGDAAGNSITLAESGGTLTVAGVGTTINGNPSAAYSVAAFTRINMMLNAGDDTVAFLPASNLAGKDIVANLGTATALGGDTFTANNLTAKDLSVTTSAGSDTVAIDTLFAQNLTLKVGGANANPQSIDLDNLTLTGALNINAGAAADPVGTSVDLDSSNVTGVVAILTNSKGCDIDVDGLAGSALTIRAVATTDVALGTATANDLSGALNVTVGATSSITVGSSGLGNVVDGLATLVAGGSSSISVTDVEFNGNVIAKTANGTTNTIAFDEIDIAGTLTVAMGNSTDSTLTLFDDDGAADIGGQVGIVIGNASGTNTLTLGGPAADLAIAGNVALTMGNGTNNLTLENVTIFNAGSSRPLLSITNRNGDNTITLNTVVVEAGVTIRAGNAPTQNTVAIDGLTTGGSLLVGLGIALTNDVDILNSSIGVGFSYDLTIQAGGGVNSTIDLSGVAIGRKLIVTTQTGDDDIDVEDSTIGGGTTINTGLGFDTVTFGATGTTFFGALVTVNLGGDDDTLNIGTQVSATGAFTPLVEQIAFNGNGGVNTINCALFDPFVAPFNKKIANFTP